MRKDQETCGCGGAGRRNGELSGNSGQLPPLLRLKEMVEEMEQKYARASEAKEMPPRDNAPAQ